MPDAVTNNRLLLALAPVTRDRLLQEAQFVELPVRIQLFASDEVPRHLYFLTAGVASVVFTSDRGSTVELATLGNEGLVGWNYLLGPRTTPMECMIQVEACGYRVPVATLHREFRECEEFRTLVLEFAQHQDTVTNQIVACNRLHRAEARFARWLLMVQDRIHSDTMKITQEFLSAMLGTRRTTVVEVAASLERASAIESRRGLVRISSRERLEGRACECYPLLRELLAELYGGRG